jgi:signal transduction histidine kinase
MIQPLTESYNHLVVRLRELEKESTRYRDTLEQEVRTATEALLVQNRNLASAERLATAGEVAARIAHELRNPLAGMQMALSNIRIDCQDHKDVVERIDLVIDELRRITGLVNGLLDQSRITPEPIVVTVIGKVIEELLTIVRYQIPKEIELRSDIADEIVCRMPKDSLRQALLNLILNAADAIGANAGQITVHAAASGDMLELAVSDDGPGFPAEILREGISPFRTGRAGGTGLGLSIVSRLVRNLDGRIELLNVEPHGARVRLLLPFRGANA